jgi:purine-binding chemotaxis protein CheW
MSLSDYLCFKIDDIRLGIPLHYVDRVIRSVAVQPLPNPPKNIHGLIDFYGEVVPVMNLRYQLALREKPVSPDQIFVMIKTKDRKLALVADQAEGLITLSESDLIPSHQLDRDIKATSVYLTTVGVVLIYDPEKFLSAREEIQLKISLQSKQMIKTNDESPSKIA